MHASKTCTGPAVPDGSFERDGRAKGRPVQSSLAKGFMLPRRVVARSVEHDLVVLPKALEETHGSVLEIALIRGNFQKFADFRLPSKAPSSLSQRAERDR
jgi:hypothetical protein